MELNRRTFLCAAGTGAYGLLGLDVKAALSAEQRNSLVVREKEITTSICPYCAVGCGLLVTSGEVSDDPHGRRRVVIDVQGDPDHPINEGTLCSKGTSLLQLANNPKRLGKVLYRAPRSTSWQEKDARWAAKEIAKRIKRTRDESFTTTVTESGKPAVVNRTTAIASCGSAALDNEECWLFQKMLRGLGLVYIEHQARL